ncbi:MAG: hypothetical protein WC829_16860 [Hyphomicrobium sp.]|jgi:hypothetical protein
MAETILQDIDAIKNRTVTASDADLDAIIRMDEDQDEQVEAEEPTEDSVQPPRIYTTAERKKLVQNRNRIKRLLTSSFKEIVAHYEPILERLMELTPEEAEETWMEMDNAILEHETATFVVGSYVEGVRMMEGFGAVFGAKLEGLSERLGKNPAIGKTIELMMIRTEFKPIDPFYQLMITTVQTAMYTHQINTKLDMASEQRMQQTPQEVRSTMQSPRPDNVATPKTATK